MNKDYQAEVDALNEALDSLSDEFTEYLSELCDKAALNWLRLLGIPKTPNEVWSIFSVLYRGLPATLIKDGKFIPAEGVLVDSDEKAERQAQREQQLSLDISPSKSEVIAGLGQYL